MLFLENANLLTSTFNNIVFILIADAKDKNKSIKQHIHITEVKFTAIENSFEKVILTWKQYHTQTGLENEDTVTIQEVDSLWDDYK